MSANGIVVIGAVFVDIKGFPLSQYIPAGRNSGRVEQVHGGVCRNIAEDIGNIELRPTLVSLVDETGTGEDVIHKLDNHKVNTKYMRKVPDGMGTWLAVFDNSGDVVASISKRPDLMPICDILDEQGDEIFADCDSIVFEMDIEKEIVKRLLGYAKKYGKKVYCGVSNMSIAVERRDFIRETDCFVCNIQEAGILFFDDYEGKTAGEMLEILKHNLKTAGINSMVVTMGGQGAVYADKDGNGGICPAKKVTVIDTTGAGDSFFAGVSVGLTYGKSMAESCEIGARLAASVIATTESVCPRFLPSEFGISC
ncbi:MAG: carbohydrate kinase family protein [Clostridia bacterium]|nr:carbohydrate kinase family protein [Clostridia bacterium]